MVRKGEEVRRAGATSSQVSPNRFPAPVPEGETINGAHLVVLREADDLGRFVANYRAWEPLAILFN